MTQLEHFMAYAAAFEQTFKDDDWSRLAPFFTDDVTYQVSGLPAACTIHGRDAMFAGMKKSLDGFDRRMTKRRIVPTAPPSANGDTITFQGYVTYERDGAPPIDLHATLVAEFSGDRIIRMHDTFALDGAAMKWLGQHAGDLDGSYV
ncbi:MAG: nuclear transport factor 2 family protein [Kofleriaceae bacterium]